MSYKLASWGSKSSLCNSITHICYEQDVHVCRNEDLFQDRYQRWIMRGIWHFLKNCSQPFWKWTEIQDGHHSWRNSMGCIPCKSAQYVLSFEYVMGKTYGCLNKIVNMLPSGRVITMYKSSELPIWTKKSTAAQKLLHRFEHILFSPHCGWNENGI